MPKSRTIVTACASAFAVAAAALVFLVVTQRHLDRRDQRAYRVGEAFAVLKDGRRIRYRARGPTSTGPTILLVAGLDAPIEAWHTLMSALPSSISTLAFDRAGIGLSDADTRPMSAQSSAQDIVELLDTLKIKGQVIPVCFSLGGLICHVLASRFPERISSLVLLDPTNPDEWTTVSKSSADRNIHEFLTLIPRQAVKTRLGLTRLKSWITQRRVELFELSDSHRDGVARESTSIYTLHEEVRSQPLPRWMPVTIVSAGLPVDDDCELIQGLHQKWTEQSSRGHHVIFANANHVSLRDDPANAASVAALVMRMVLRRAEAH